ncbi:carboxypeptidase [Telmatospirillum siberiense]|uniref:Carboxypeptidase n=2 Tax=Telmatospirillum siberiense TaxID=382514 RepID=A0A2N3PSL4_9PROT|nr:carboxypeptidase [Telmatospirillum siberiense]
MASSFFGRGPRSMKESRSEPPPPPDRGGTSKPPPPRPPRNGRGPRPPGSGGGRRLLGMLINFSLTVAIWVAIGLGGVIAYYAYDLPDLENLTATARRPSITLLSADGETIAAYGDVYGEPVNLQDLPASLPQAVMATEDRHFYSHFGLDLIGLARAMVVNLRAGHVVQGGSTITQQLAKNLFLTPERSLKRKVQELLMALWLEHKFSKDQILTLYLNRVYLGNGTWGVDAAARRYFDVPATRLNLYQSALLAGLLKAPSRYNPQNDREQSVKRTTQVLANMVAFGVISPEQASEALKNEQSSVRQVSHTGRYFADWIHDLVDQYARDDRDIVVRTTLDMGLQRRVEAELEALLAKSGSKAGVSQAAMVVMTPDGAIRALTGGRDYATSQFNRAVQGFRQPGSSFKAMLYLAAVEAGWDENDMIEDSPITTGKYQPENIVESHRYEGSITLRHALAKSSNVAAVRLIERIGPKRVVAVAKRLGITSQLHSDASLALGTGEVNLVELTSAYATFANAGNGVFPFGFTEVRDNRGNVIYHREGAGTGQIISPHALREMDDMLSAVVTEGTGKAAAIDRPIAGKTGTSQDYRDAWFIGFSADYVGGVWFGNDDGTSMHRTTGGSLPAQLWHNVMLAAHKGLPARPLPGQGGEEAPSAENESGRPSQPAETLDNIWNGLVKMLGG